jgi:thymidylate synthase ThyX
VLAIPEAYTEEEKAILSRYFTNLDRDVFALKNLPEVVKGALFARYSRSAKPLRRLFLDEFVEDVAEDDHGPVAVVSVKRAEALYDKVLAEYGDDSIAQLGAAHVACEGCSNLVTKVIERSRVMSYLEQSTRYIPYDRQGPDGRFRYVRPKALLESRHGARYIATMDRQFSGYSKVLKKTTEYLRGRLQPNAPIDLATERAIRATALDAARLLLPIGCASNVGVFGSGQAFEYLIIRLRAHPLTEANDIGQAIKEELLHVIPAFLRRVDAPEKGLLWSEYLRRTTEGSRAAFAEVLQRSGQGCEQTQVRIGRAPRADRPVVKLASFDEGGEDEVLAHAFVELGGCSLDAARQVVAGLPDAEKDRLFDAYVGDRLNRRHKPGRALEAATYTFEVVSDYGSFRDLQRHRMLTMIWQDPDPSLGYVTPELVEEAGAHAEYKRSVSAGLELYHRLREEFPTEAVYALPMATKVRYVVTMNAREAMHVIELRSDPQGHPLYRQIVLAMRDAIAQVAGHRRIAAAMRFVSAASPHLGRLAAERRSLAKVQRASRD